MRSCQNVSHILYSHMASHPPNGGLLQSLPISQWIRAQFLTKALPIKPLRAVGLPCHQHQYLQSSGKQLVYQDLLAEPVFVGLAVSVDDRDLPSNHRRTSQSGLPTNKWVEKMLMRTPWNPALAGWQTCRFWKKTMNCRTNFDIFSSCPG